MSRLNQMLLLILGSSLLIGSVLMGFLIWYGVDMDHRTGEDFWFFFYDFAAPGIWFLGIIPWFLGVFLLIWASALQKNSDVDLQKLSTHFRVVGFVFSVLTCLGILVYIFSGHYFFNSFEYGFWSGLQDFLPGLVFFLTLPLLLISSFFASGKSISKKSGFRMSDPTLANTFS